MKPITSDSLYEIVHVDDVQVSPDGSRVAFVRTGIDRSANEYVHSIWIKDVTSADSLAQPFTTGRKDGSPRWSEDGSRLGFISSREGEAKVFVLPMSGGEAQCVATHPNGVNSFEWSPDGRRIAFTATQRSDEHIEED